MQLFLYPLEDHPGTRLVTQNHFLAGSVEERQDHDPAAHLMRNKGGGEEDAILSLSFVNPFLGKGAY